MGGALESCAFLVDCGRRRYCENVRFVTSINSESPELQKQKIYIVYFAVCTAILSF